MKTHTKDDPRVVRLSDLAPGMLRALAEAHLKAHDAYFAIVSGTPTKVIR